jgi:alpha-1,3-rhamnosyltransferase
MTKPLISVIIPAYNHSKYIQETISSIINQTYEKLELIIVDDGSTDDTWQKINELRSKCEKRFDNIDFTTRANRGLISTLDELIKKTKGQYTYFIASDDVAKDNALETLYNNIGGNVLSVGDNEFIDGDSQEILWGGFETFAQMLQQSRFKGNFHNADFGTYASFVKRVNYVPNGYLVDGEKLRQTSTFTKNAPLEDLYMHLQLSKLGKYKYVNEVLFSYRLHATNTIKQRQKMRENARCTIQCELKQLLKDNNTKFLSIFNNNFETKKIKFNIFNLIRIVKVKTFLYSYVEIYVGRGKYYFRIHTKRSRKYFLSLPTG